MADPNQIYPDTPEGWAARWKTEMEYANKRLGEYRKKGEEVRKTYLDQRVEVDLPATRLNLFHSNVTTVRSMLYGNIPKVDVSRRYFDPDDNVARVASEILSRVLNLDLQRTGANYAHVMRQVLEDRLLPGCGQARLRYDCNIESEKIPEVRDSTGKVVTEETTQDNVTDEWTEECYVPWLDYAWSPCRFYAELRWQAFRSYMDKDEVETRFGKAIADAIGYDAKSPIDKQHGADKNGDVWNKAEIWEIWYKGDMCVYWWTPNYPKILDCKSDPLKIDNFWPNPPPMIANTTTGEWIPTSDYVIAQDLYKGVDTLQDRIQNLTEACKAVGLYDKNASDDLGNLLKPGTENQMIPVDNWAMFAEKGGIKGVIDFLPLEQVIETVDKLTTLQDRKIQQLYEVTGMAEITRGGGDADASATLTTAQVKFGSIRLQALQDEFARFATDMQKIKYEIIAKHWDPQTIINCSNIMSSPDGVTNPQVIQQAVQLIKDSETALWKIEIKPEQLAMTDYAQIRQERSEYINAVSLFMQSAAPLIEQNPDASPLLLELLKWGLAGFKGSNQIEGVLDQGIQAMIKKQQAAAANPQPPQPDPKLQVEQVKGQNALELEQAKGQNQQAKAQADVQETMAQHQGEMAAMIKQTQLRLSEMIAEFRLEMRRQLHERVGDLVQGHQESEFAQDMHEHKIAEIEAQSGTPTSEDDA